VAGFYEHGEERGP